MAKTSATAKIGGTSRLRFVMLDAELADGDLTQITQAIHNALRPTTVVQQRAIPAPTATTESGDGVLEEAVGNSVGPEGGPDFVEQRQPRTTKPRRYRSPKVLDLDLSGDPSFSEYIHGKKLESEPDRFLAIAAWFKDHKDTSEITVDHAYTCYRAANWHTGFEDFAWPLRSLKQQQWMMSPGRGRYCINHLGLSRIQKLSGA